MALEINVHDCADLEDEVGENKQEKPKDKKNIHKHNETKDKVGG